jgi:hypothetical protein
VRLFKLHESIEAGRTPQKIQKVRVHDVEDVLAPLDNGREWLDRVRDFLDLDEGLRNA